MDIGTKQESRSYPGQYDKVGLLISGTYGARTLPHTETEEFEVFEDRDIAIIDRPYIFAVSGKVKVLQTSASAKVPVIHYYFEYPSETMTEHGQLQDIKGGFVYTFIQQTLGYGELETEEQEETRSQIIRNRMVVDVVPQVEIGHGCSVTVDEYHRRYADIDLEYYRQRMSPDVFKLFIETMGIADGISGPRPDVAAEERE